MHQTGQSFLLSDIVLGLKLSLPLLQCQDQNLYTARMSLDFRSKVRKVILFTNGLFDLIPAIRDTRSGA